MMLRVVTIEREFGSGGGKIAKLLAERLGWKLWDQLLTSEIARQAQCDRAEVERREERMDPLYYRLLKSFLRGSFEGSLNVHRLKLLDADAIFRLTERIVREAATEGNSVIVGRGSAFFLENRRDAFHAFLYAPYEDKIRRVAESGTDPAEAIRLVDTVDRERADFIKKYFDKVWPCRTLYHLMINSQIGDEAVVQTILNGMETLQKQPIQFPA
ncbi:MAG TPA: cytidylate kinase-like family protein [Terriglobia bacterium]|nr:cytidylate kinase-like family protein [Terriglobia bacterium]